MKNKIKTRALPESNYRAVFIDGKTLRFAIDPSKPITELKRPEFYDVALGDKCMTGCCPYCYAGASRRGRYYADICQKITDFFGPMSENDRPFQVAIGGSSEPLEHDDFWPAVGVFNNLGIMANYTTNGVLVTKDVAKKTRANCGGVAISCHPHLAKYWTEAIHAFARQGVTVNLHCIISDRASVEDLVAIFANYAKMAEYFVLLPHMNTGRAASHPRQIDYAALEAALPALNMNQLAFGSNFHQWMKDFKMDEKFGVNLYEPEIMSKYLVLDTPVAICNNSFEKRPVKWPM